MKKVLKIITSYLEDVFIISGLLLIAGTTFFINMYAGFYVTGGILLTLGIYFTKHPLRR